MICGLRRTPQTSALAVLGLLACAAGVGYTHNYLPEAEDPGAPTAIPSIEVSHASYRELTSADQVDVYEFQAEAGQSIYVQITIPLFERLQEFAPVVALSPSGPVTEGMELSQARLLGPGDLPHAVLDVVDADNILVVGSDGTKEAFHESFTGTDYWIRQTLSVPASAPGTYRLYVFSPEGGTGKYVLATGRAERFSFGDVLGLPGVRITVRRYMEQPVVGDYVFWTVLAAVIAGSAVAGIAWAVVTVMR